MSAEPPPKSLSEIRTYSLNLPGVTDQATSSNQNLAIGIDITQYLDGTEVPHIHTRFCLIKTFVHNGSTEPSDATSPDRVVAQLSADTPDPSIDAIDIKTMFHFGASKELLQQLLDLKVLEKVSDVESASTASDLDSEQPRVRLILPEKDVAKRCAQCGRWEQQSLDQARLLGCSGCKLACECQRENWKDGIPTPHKKVCRRGK
ncbi:hypothetical protein FRB93_012446 [Tulasnella sp. JGI-2019a]|nr:hypothetical protein FRB93_012446 [Tulasnella sp. JGI-2019a]